MRAHDLHIPGDTETLFWDSSYRRRDETEAIGDRVIVRRHASEDKSTGGILLPDAAKKKPQKGTVLAVGRAELTKDGTVAARVKEGDTVLFTAWAATSSRNAARRTSSRHARRKTSLRYWANLQAVAAFLNQPSEFFIPETP